MGRALLNPQPANKGPRLIAAVVSRLAIVPPPPAINVEQYFDLVTRLARRVKAKLPQSVELDDLIQEGRIGLMQAAERFDASRGVPFTVYAERRITGSMYSICRRKNYQFEWHAEINTNPSSSNAAD